MKLAKLVVIAGLSSIITTGCHAKSIDLPPPSFETFNQFLTRAERVALDRGSYHRIGIYLAPITGELSPVERNFTSNQARELLDRVLDAYQMTTDRTRDLFDRVIDAYKVASPAWDEKQRKDVKAKITDIAEYLEEPLRADKIEAFFRSALAERNSAALMHLAFMYMHNRDMGKSTIDSLFSVGVKYSEDKDHYYRRMGQLAVEQAAESLGKPSQLYMKATNLD